MRDEIAMMILVCLLNNPAKREYKKISCSKPATYHHIDMECLSYWISTESVLVDDT